MSLLATLGITAVQAAVAPVAHADTDTYSWSNATYVDANYDWGYSTCPVDDTDCMKFSGLNNGVRYGESDPWGYYLRNCTSYVAEKINQVSGKDLSGWGNAANWATAAQKAGYALDVTSAPQVGDIAVWGTEKADGYGHVAYVYNVSGGIASLDEYNVAGTGAFTSNRTTSSNSAGTPDWYIHMGTPGNSGGQLGNGSSGLSTRRGDFNGDGKDDVAWHQGSNTLYLLTANGTSFSYGGSNAVNAPIGTPDWAAGGNVDGNGASEVYWYQAGANTLYILRWTGSTWALEGSTPGLGMPDHAVVGDFNGDGKDDVAWHQGTTLTLLVSNGTSMNWGGANPANLPIGTPDWAGAGNVDGSKTDDVFWYQASNQTLYTLRWGGTTWNLIASTPGLGMPDHAVVGDFNGDGRADIAWHQGSSLFLLMGNADGTFSYGGSNAANAPIGTPDWAGAGNIDGSGPSEVYWYQSGTQTLYVLRWAGSTWALEGSTPGLGMPDHAVSAG